MPETLPNRNTSFGAAQKLITPTILYYLFAILIVFIGDKYMPSGPCTPGLGAIAFLLAVPVSFILLFRNIYLGFKMSKTNFLVAALHTIILTTIAIIMR